MELFGLKIGWDVARAFLMDLALTVFAAGFCKRWQQQQP
jgi:hypothetical protein